MASNNTYLARGRKKGSKDWVRGYYVKCRGHHYILEQYNDNGYDERWENSEWVEVDPETVGLYLGSNSKGEFFEGDRIACGSSGEATLMINPYGFFEDTNDGWLDEWNWADDSHRFKVIGTIFDERQ